MDAPSPSATGTAVAPEVERFVARLRASLADGSFTRLQLARSQGGDPTLEKLLARRILLRGQERLSLVWRHRSKDVTKNLPVDEAVALVSGLVPAPFQHAHLVTRTHDVQLVRDRQGRLGLRVGRLGGPDAARQAVPAADAAPAEHNRLRQRPLTLAEPFLAELGVTDAQQRLVPAMARKWRQINKFAEVLGHAIDSSAALRDAATIRVLDFGAGKGYLTFAVHQLLGRRGVVPDVVGVELREELTAEGNGIAQRLGLAGLRFDAGDVRSHAQQTTDIMIALHACDTATDVAMHRGITAGAAIIVCSPCCHKQLRPQMKSPAALEPVLRHGIHMTEQAEMLTDALRALLLQSAGYDAQVFEFVSPEHTARNRMVLAVRRARPLPAGQAAALRQRAEELMAFFGVREQYLHGLLVADASGLPPPREFTVKLLPDEPPAAD